jgi:hypothetical protein
VILVKIVKIGQLQAGVESRESIMHSDFFRLKHSVTIAEQEKFHIEGFLWRPSSKKKIPSDHDHLVTRYAGAGRVQTINFFYLKIE